MLKDITLGQYFPGDTVAHRLDPRTKLLLVIIYIVGLFNAVGWASYAFVILITALSMAVSKIKPKSALKGLKPLIIIIILTAVLNIFYTGGTPIIEGWIITWEGIERAVMMSLRIILLIVGTFMLTYTTSPIALTDGLEIMLNPLKKIKIPVHEMSMMMSMALRFIPTLIEETDKIMSAQKARGADFDSGNLFRRARKLRKNTCVLQNAPPVLRSCQRAEREIIHKHCDLLLSPSYASARPFDTDRARSRSFCILCIFLQKVSVKT